MNALPPLSWNFCGVKNRIKDLSNSSTSFTALPDPVGTAIRQTMGHFFVRRPSPCWKDLLQNGYFTPAKPNAFPE